MDTSESEVEQVADVRKRPAAATKKSAAKSAEICDTSGETTEARPRKRPAAAMQEVAVSMRARVSV